MRMQEAKRKTVMKAVNGKSRVNPTDGFEPAATAPAPTAGNPRPSTLVAAPAQQAAALPLPVLDITADSSAAAAQLERTRRLEAEARSEKLLLEVHQLRTQLSELKRASAPGPGETTLPARCEGDQGQTKPEEASPPASAYSASEV